MRSPRHTTTLHRVRTPPFRVLTPPSQATNEQPIVPVSTGPRIRQRLFSAQICRTGPATDANRTITAPCASPSSRSVRISHPLLSGAKRSGYGPSWVAVFSCAHRSSLVSNFSHDSFEQVLAYRSSPALAARGPTAQRSSSAVGFQYWCHSVSRSMRPSRTQASMAPAAARWRASSSGASRAAARRAVSLSAARAARRSHGAASARPFSAAADASRTVGFELPSPATSARAGWSAGPGAANRPQVAARTTETAVIRNI